MRTISKEELLNDIKEMKINIEFVKTHCKTSYYGTPKQSVLKKYNMQLWAMNKKLSLMV